MKSGLTLALTLAAASVTSSVAQPEDAASFSSASAVAAVQRLMVATGLPSASVGVAQDGHIVWMRSFGDARLVPVLPADINMAYPVGSISKQFTATCVLLLAEDGVLRLDDPVARWFPQLTQARNVTVRELLSHTSGYEDYAPQDYTIPAWTKTIDPMTLVNEWAGKPLDFEPGTQWQYSNTNFVLAALIVQKASGMPYIEFLRRRVLQPLGLNGVLDLDTQRGQLQPLGYERRALAPLRPAVLEAPGWYFGDAALAMPVGTLLKWDLSIINRSLLKPQSYAEFETPVTLKGGSVTRYGLGISVGEYHGQQMLEHSGEVGGFVAENIILPQSKAAVVVLTNQEATTAAHQIAFALLPLLPSPVAAKADTTSTPEEQQLNRILSGLQSRKIDRTLFTADANAYFSAATLDDFSSSLRPLGAISTVRQIDSSLRGGMTFRRFEVTFADGTRCSVSTYTVKDGRLEQLLLEATP